MGKGLPMPIDGEMKESGEIVAMVVTATSAAMAMV
eukprot:CAMPEP_0172541686 /NCGR_PEP_ID=MMETSP1067-20121228/12459_1 /TAXON_ID=265564 ORGANISM="Thalassiosira punctigera, Strain Tpunct2005C2" /NCGR_SAMPLE_ID=MMETSP1067 /ASSEMBLY_ACC=CAM_ASM_000444 /LENGTH=34 /DNA_ID= /DNA_START= /DNA_END= /DNA_ORIENTATION=